MMSRDESVSGHDTHVCAMFFVCVFVRACMSVCVCLPTSLCLRCCMRVCTYLVRVLIRSDYLVNNPVPGHRCWYWSPRYVDTVGTNLLEEKETFP